MDVLLTIDCGNISYDHVYSNTSELQANLSFPPLICTSHMKTAIARARPVLKYTSVEIQKLCPASFPVK